MTTTAPSRTPEVGDRVRVYREGGIFCRTGVVVETWPCLGGSFQYQSEGLLYNANRHSTFDVLDLCVEHDVERDDHGECPACTQDALADEAADRHYQRIKERDL